MQGPAARRGAPVNWWQAEEQGCPLTACRACPLLGLLRNGRATNAPRPSPPAPAAAYRHRDGLPYVSLHWAVEEVIERARRHGIGFGASRTSAHVGVLGIHLCVAQAGLAGFAFTNPPGDPAWGGKKALFGTNPVAAVFPRNGKQPLVIDLALTTVVRGKIMMAMRRGERIPEGWALDRHGRPTTDPKEAIEHGSLFPIGGAKGAMLALMFELMCAALTGAAIGAEADSFFSEQGNRPRIGQAFIASIRARSPAWSAISSASKRLSRQCPDPEVRLPGPAALRPEKAAASGIEVPTSSSRRSRSYVHAVLKIPRGTWACASMRPHRRDSPICLFPCPNNP